MSGRGSPLPPQQYTHQPNKQETTDCPYLFEDLEAIYYQASLEKVTYYARWHGRDVWSRHVKGPWNYDDSNKEITIDDWNEWYPGYKHLTFRDQTPKYFGQYTLNKDGQRRLFGKYNGKAVLWSPSKGTFIYLNNLSVTFPPDRSQPPLRAPSRASREPSRAQSPEDSQNEQVITSLLERTGQVLATLTEEVRRKSPEPSSVGAPPGTFPETPPSKQTPTVLPTPVTERETTRITAVAAPTLPTVPQSPTTVLIRATDSLGQSSPSQPVASIATQARIHQRVNYHQQLWRRHLKERCLQLPCPLAPLHPNRWEVPWIHTMESQTRLKPSGAP